MSRGVEHCEGNFLRRVLRKEFGVKKEEVVKEREKDYVLSYPDNYRGYYGSVRAVYPELIEGSLPCTVGKLIRHCECCFIDSDKLYFHTIAM